MSELKTIDLFYFIFISHFFFIFYLGLGVCVMSHFFGHMSQKI